MRKLAAEELFGYAVKYLAQRACSAEELRQKLRLKAAEPADIAGVLDRLKELGYLNDARFAESFALNRVDNDGFGKMRVLRDLRARRIASKLADETVGQVFEGRSEPDLIDSFIERRMPSLAAGRLNDEKKIAAAYRRLRRAGFTPGHSISALKRIAARPELLDEEPPEEASEEE